MASWSCANEVRGAAADAARANRYLDEQSSRGRRGAASGDVVERRPAGRKFDAQALHRLGIAGLLRAGHQFDADTLASEVAAYLAGPAEQMWRHIVLDIDWTVPAPIETVGWRLWQPGSDDWEALRPVPVAADYAANSVWDPLLTFGWHVVLSIPDPEEEPTSGHGIWWPFRNKPTFSLEWEPLLLLNLWNDTPVKAVAEYLVEPGRAADRVYASLPSTYSVNPDGTDEIEIPLLGPLHVEDSQGFRFIRFINELHARMRQWDTPSTNAEKKRFTKARDRVRRSAVKFLQTSGDVSQDGDVFFQDDRPQVVFGYVSALENLLSAGDEDKIDLRRRAAQRAAVLVGRNDEHRQVIYDQVYRAYGVRNSIAHGDEPKAEMVDDAVKHLRQILRRALIAAIVLGPQQELSALCDEALLSHIILRERVRMPLREFSATVQAD
ncbi:hypothetical protein GCM10027184_03100 [Saccharothrix stipae]